jgi:hypothetical protein
LKKYISHEGKKGDRYREGKAQRENVCRKGDDETACSESVETSQVFSLAAEKQSEERS